MPLYKKTADYSCTHILADQDYKLIQSSHVATFDELLCIVIDSCLSNTASTICSEQVINYNSSLSFIMLSLSLLLVCISLMLTFL